jgi:hypothetical protein
MIPANHDSRIEVQQLPRERFSPLADLGRFNNLLNRRTAKRPTLRQNLDVTTGTAVNRYPRTPATALRSDSTLRVAE